MVVLYFRHKCLTPLPIVIQWLHIDKEMKMFTKLETYAFRAVFALAAVVLYMDLMVWRPL